jgi:hypothetical protein
MIYTLDNLIESLASAAVAGGVVAKGSRIATADRYIKAIAGCLSGEGACPVQIFKLASGELWQKELADAAKRLTYCDEAMADSEFLAKSAREGTDISSGAVLEYDCILSSKRKDRDGDIVEQAGGLELDKNMPALWQHIQLSPIGKHVAMLSQDEHFASRSASSRVISFRSKSSKAPTAASR